MKLHEHSSYKDDNVSFKYLRQLQILLGCRPENVQHMSLSLAGCPECERPSLMPEHCMCRRTLAAWT